MGRFIDLAGRTFHRLTVLERAPVDTVKPAWRCRCACGRLTIVDGYQLRSGHTKSCGCWRVDEIAARSFKHGHAKRGRITSERQIWGLMKDRCANPKNKSFPYYGGRGIRVCDRWRGSYEAFLADMGPRPKNYTLDRIDANGDYAPDNCRWATRREQGNNKRNNRLVQYRGETMTLAQLVGLSGVDYVGLMMRLRAGQQAESAVAAMQQRKAKRHQ